MKLIDLFPPCTNDACPEKAKVGHKHILPKQQEVFDSSAKFLALIGGFGSGKTLPACIMGHLLSTTIPGNLGIVMRESLPKLHDSTERIYLEVLKRSGVEASFHENRDLWPHRIIYPNGSEVVFRETKDAGRFLGPEYGWYIQDEAQELPEKLFKDLSGRLRLPRARDYLKGMILTNPPSRQHWIAKTFPKEGIWTREVRLPNGQLASTTWQMIQSMTYDNPFLSPEYLAQLLTLHTDAEIKRIVEGHYGFTAEGDPVYPQFNPLRNIADMEIKRMALYRVWDFGFHRPAISWSQMFRCSKGKVHVTVLDELLEEDKYAEDLAPIAFKQQKETFPDFPAHLVMDGGDAAGAAVNDKGPGPIIRLGKPKTEGGFDLRFRYRKFVDIDPGLDAVRRLLKTKCACGFQLLMVHRRCRNLIEALSGGYHYPKEKPGREKGKKPVKDGFYDNIADTLRYAIMLFYLPIENGIDSIPIDPLSINPQPHSWSWMERLTS